MKSIIINFISESLNYLTFLLEDKIDDVRNRYEVKEDEMEWMKDVDPTSNKKYLDFIAKMYKKNNEPEEKVKSLKPWLMYFDKDKIRNTLEKKDINQYKTVAEFEDVMKNIDITDPKYLSKKELKENGLILELQNWNVYSPVDKLQAIQLGKQTPWCTSYDDRKKSDLIPIEILNAMTPEQKYDADIDMQVQSRRNMFDKYVSKKNGGRLFLFINKKDPSLKGQLYLGNKTTGSEYQKGDKEITENDLEEVLKDPKIQLLKPFIEKEFKGMKSKGENTYLKTITKKHEYVKQENATNRLLEEPKPTLEKFDLYAYIKSLGTNVYAKENKYQLLGHDYSNINIAVEKAFNLDSGLVIPEKVNLELDKLHKEIKLGVQELASKRGNKHAKVDGLINTVIAEINNLSECKNVRLHLGSLMTSLYHLKFSQQEIDDSIYKIEQIPILFKNLKSVDELFVVNLSGHKFRDGLIINERLSLSDCKVDTISNLISNNANVELSYFKLNNSNKEIVLPKGNIRALRIHNEDKDNIKIIGHSNQKINEAYFSKHCSELINLNIGVIDIDLSINRFDIKKYKLILKDTKINKCIITLHKMTNPTDVNVEKLKQTLNDYKELGIIKTIEFIHSDVIEDEPDDDE